MNASRALIQVDLDPLWAVRQCYGLTGAPPGASAPADPVWDRAVPAFLELFDAFGLKASFFVVGRDTTHPRCRGRLTEIMTAGHEVANHTQSHRIDLLSMADPSLSAEIDEAQERLTQVCGRAPLGFRAPGYAMNPRLFEAVAQRQFLYDASVLPTAWGWALRTVARLIALKSQNRHGQYGHGPVGQAPLKPYRPDPLNFLRPITADSEEKPLWEIPVTVTPGWRLPFHAGIAMALGRTYFRRSLHSVAAQLETINFVFHGVDLLDLRDDAPARGALAGRLFGQSLPKKKAEAAFMLEAIQAHYAFERADHWARRNRGPAPNPLRQPSPGRGITEK